MEKEIYQSLYTLNESLQLVAEHLEKLKAAGVLPAMFVDIRKAAAEQMRAEINHRIIGSLEHPEAMAAMKFQKLRLELEAKLKGDADAPLAR